jgi:hypothetical protein
VNGDTVRALRHAREIVYDMHWCGMTVPAVYAHMTQEFQALVRSGVYAAWVATSQKARGRQGTMAEVLGGSTRRADRSRPGYDRAGAHGSRAGPGDPY